MRWGRRGRLKRPAEVGADASFNIGDERLRGLGRTQMQNGGDQLSGPEWGVRESQNMAGDASSHRAHRVLAWTWCHVAHSPVSLVVARSWSWRVR